MPDPILSRRRFLILGSGAVAATAAGGAYFLSSDPSSRRVRALSPLVGAGEARRRRAGARVVDVALTAGAIDLALGARTAPTWAYGPSVPGPEIRLTAGDVLRARVSNRLPEGTTVHWHGIALRNDMDGVPGVTQDPIAAGADFTYEFTVPDPGTYIYHSHFGVQLDRGLYGPLIVDDPAEPGDYDAELVVVLDDWLDGVQDTPEQTLQALQQGMAMGSMDTSSMGTDSVGGMDMGVTGDSPLGADVGDVDYPLYLINGRPPEDPFVFEARPGQRVRLRIISIGADRPFRVALGGHRLTLTHTDGFPIEPVTGDAVLLGMGERYDAVVTLGDGAFPLVAVPEGMETGALAVLRTAAGSAPPADSRPQELTGRLLTSADVAATEAVTLASRTPDRTLAVRLDGDMGSYRWTINGDQFDPADPFTPSLDVRQGERVRLSFDNRSMMFHPMHLHGHTFQVRNAGGSGPRKDTVIVPPGERLDVDFDADNPGQWALHCHNIYHAEAGMMTVVSYVT